MVICVYCGEEPATAFIVNPNDDEVEVDWEVCEDCKVVIGLQRRLGFGMHIMQLHKGDAEKSLYDFGKKIHDEAQTGLDAFAERTGKPSFSVEITKRDDGGLDIKETLTLGGGEKR